MLGLTCGLRLAEGSGEGRQDLRDGSDRLLVPITGCDHQPGHSLGTGPEGGGTSGPASPGCPSSRPVTLTE